MAAFKRLAKCTYKNFGIEKFKIGLVLAIYHNLHLHKSSSELMSFLNDIKTKLTVFLQFKAYKISAQITH